MECSSRMEAEISVDIDHILSDLCDYQEILGLKKDENDELDIDATSAVSVYL